MDRKYEVDRELSSLEPTRRYGTLTRMEQQKSRCNVKEGRGDMEECKRKGPTDKHWFSNLCRERRGDRRFKNVQKEECLRY
jgi:hypothetical protein